MIYILIFINTGNINIIFTLLYPRIFVNGKKTNFRKLFEEYYLTHQ